MPLTNPSISVIVPIFNAEEYLIECLNSITNQTLKDIEIICVNDGSEDNSGKILEDYQKKDKRIIIINKKNGGLSSARNAGMKAAAGEYIGFVDSDDWIDPNFFEQLYKIAKENAAVMSMGNVVWFSGRSYKTEEKSWIEKLVKSIKPDIVVSVSDRKKVIDTNSVWNKLFLRNFLNRNNIWFYEGLFWEDNPFTTMTTIIANKICLVRDVFYHYRRHKDSITNIAGSDRRPFDIFEVMTKLKVFFDSMNIHLMKGYDHYYEELLVKQYSSHLFFRINKTFRKEYYFRVKSEFKKLNNYNPEKINSDYVMFKLINDYNYSVFIIIYHLIQLIRYTYKTALAISGNFKIKNRN